MRQRTTHIVHSNLRKPGLGSTYKNAQRDERAAAADGGVAHAETTPQDELYCQKVLDADAARENGHDRLQRDVGGGEQRERVWNVVGGEIGILDERACSHETNVCLVDSAELVDWKVRLWNVSGNSAWDLR